MATSRKLTSQNLFLLDREELLDTPIKKLPLSLERYWVKRNINRLKLELRAKGIKFTPFIWISDDWFSPDGIAGFAVPFYILHPRLIELEREMIGDVEGGDPTWCMQLMRHETGHSMDNAFYLRRNKRRQKLFGLTSVPYPDSYLPNPRSKSFVRHLQGHYAQAHPDEDWAETFAVWLTPRSGWRARYRDTKAIEKLDLLDEMMESLHGKSALNKKKEKIDSYKDMSMTLRDYYRLKRIRYGLNKSPMFKKDLKRIFSTKGEIPAWKFIHNHKNQIIRDVAHKTELHQFKIRKIVIELQKACRAEKLRYNFSYTNNKQGKLKKDQLIRLIMDNTDHFFQERSPRIRM